MIGRDGQTQVVVRRLLEVARLAKVAYAAPSTAESRAVIGIERGAFAQTRGQVGGGELAAKSMASAQPAQMVASGDSPVKPPARISSLGQKAQLMGVFRVVDFFTQIIAAQDHVQIGRVEFY